MLPSRIFAWWSEVLRRDRLHRQHILEGRRLRDQQQRQRGPQPSEMPATGEEFCRTFVDPDLIDRG